MRFVEKHIFRKTHPYYKELDSLAFLSKNLYNSALYTIRQHFCSTGKYLNYNSVQQEFQNYKNPDYYALPAKVSQQVLRILDKNYVSYFRLKKSKENTKPPYYKHKENGRNVVVYTNQALSFEKGKDFNIIQLSKTNIKIHTKLEKDKIKQVRILRRPYYYKIEIVYEKEFEFKILDPSRFASIDLGVNNLAALIFNKDYQPQLINGKPLKSINQFYNKENAKYKSFLDNKYTSNKIEKLAYKRNNKVDDYLHKSSRYIINQLVSNQIGNLVIGYNPNWKQEINIGKKNNQNFVFIPFLNFVNMLKYKAEFYGISVKIITEEYTSKCSFLDNESIEKHEKYKGKRIKRGLFRSSDNKIINADLNGSGNILRKAFSKSLRLDGIEGLVVNPLKILGFS